MPGMVLSSNIPQAAKKTSMMLSMQISCVYMNAYTSVKGDLDENAAIFVSFLLFPGSRSPGSLGHLLDGQHLLHLCLCQSWLPSWSSGGP